MWLRCVYGHGRSWALQAVRAGKSGKHLQNVTRDWAQGTVSVVSLLHSVLRVPGALLFANIDDLAYMVRIVRADVR